MDAGVFLLFYAAKRFFKNPEKRLATAVFFVYNIQASLRRREFGARDQKEVKAI